MNTNRKYDYFEHILRNQGLFPCEAEIARRHSLTMEVWEATVLELEQDGFSMRDPIMGARYWPAIAAFWRDRYHVPSPTNISKYV